MTYRVKNWGKYQHYKKRCPPWIKLHYETLTSSDWVMLDDSSRVLAIACMLVASRHDGHVPADPGYIKRVAYLNQDPDFKPLISCGFLEPCKQMLADDSAAQAKCPSETESETEGETEGEARARDRSKEEEKGSVVLDEMSQEFDADLFRDMKLNPIPSFPGCPVTTEPREEYAPLKSKEANAVLAKIREYWPDYPLEQARVTAVKLNSVYARKVDVLEVITDAWGGWGPKRTIHDKGGLHVYLASYCNTAASRAPRTAQAPPRGKGNVPHQSEPSRPTIYFRLDELDAMIRTGRQIDPLAMIDDLNEAAGDGLTPTDKVREFVRDLSKAGRVQLNGRKIVDHNLPDIPSTPRELLVGSGIADPEEVKAMLGGLNWRKGQ
jgi:hypothetical protein